ncbi:MAG: DUF1553 domain-containing protein [Verrucomicrobiales bacterium]|nr:DUF1553 domain-containing protein [Verrucomicrobiales bacterium]
MHPGRWILLAGLLGLGPAAGAPLFAGPEGSPPPAAHHWSFEAVRESPIPETRDSRWPLNSIDRFILARLEAEGLTPSPSATRAEWLRRVTLDLTGIPPQPSELDAFINSTDPAAEVRVVDRLLASPRYGERWAQHWLDVVRYADTHGFEVNTERPNAWPYRDYVIRAFSRDTPYGRFVREQLCGDLLGEDAATGFLVTASVLLPGQIGKDEPSIRLARQDSLDEIVVNTGQTFLGLSIGCARCHDHKFDPVSQREYYAMQAFFAGVEYGERDLHDPDSEARRAEAVRVADRIAALQRQITRHVPAARSETNRVCVNGRLNIERFQPVAARRVRFTIRETNSLEPCLDEIEVLDPEDRNVAAASEGTRATSSGDTVVPDRHELRHIHDGRYGNSRSWMSNEKGRGWIVLEFPKEHIVDRVLWGRDREGQFDDRLATDYRVEVAVDGGDWICVADSSDRTRFLAGTTPPDPFSIVAPEAAPTLRERRRLEATAKELDGGQRAFAGLFRAPDTTHMLRRGDPEQPGEEVQPGVPAVLGLCHVPGDANESARRTALAQWLTDPRNPLTGRVWVNRIWQGHFGAGLVPTPSDFGRNGVRPTHPELLDWLAGEFQRSGESTKHLHRLIVLSATYRQSSRGNPVALSRDAESRLLWRFPSRRMEAESLRDAMLSAAGNLNAAMYGPGFDLFDLRGGLSGFKPVESFPVSGLRRMVYAHKVRREPEAVFGAFDCPDAGQSTPRRRESTTPIQALNLFNSTFTAEQSAAFARRIRQEAGDDPTRQVRLAYRIALGREPAPGELADARDAVARLGAEPLCRALFNSSEFLFLP